MLKPMDLNTLYKNILSFAGVSVDSEDYLYTSYDNKKEPYLIGGKRIALPTSNHLRTSDSNEKIIFHPLLENMNTDESVIITALTKLINVRLNVVFVALAENLLKLAASPSEHHKLNPSQTELIVSLGDVDDVTVRNFETIMLNSFKTEDSYRYFIKLYLKRRGEINKTIYAKAGIVSFPFLEKLDKDEAFDSVKLRAKDKVIFKKLFTYMLPQSDVRETYNFGSMCTKAPYLHALYKTSERLANLFNELIKDFYNFIDSPDKLTFNSDWVETFENLDVMSAEIRKIPMQIGNEGKPIITAPLQTLSMPAVTQQFTAPVNNTVPWNQPIQESPKVNNNGKLDFSEVMGNRMQQQFNQPNQQAQNVPGFMREYMGNPTFNNNNQFGNNNMYSNNNQMLPYSNL